MEAASEAYYKYGVSAEGLRWVVDHCGVAPEDTTSDVCHRILKPATVGEGWENIPVLTNAELRYYNHDYRSRATGTVLHCGFQQSDIPAQAAARTARCVSHIGVVLFGDASDDTRFSI